MQMNFMDSRTKENLMRAFAGESQARMRYYLAAQTAEQQELVALARMFRFTAEQEEQHAKVFFSLLQEAAGKAVEISADYPADVFSDIQQLIDAAAFGEMREASAEYPDFARIAKEEVFPQAEAKFSMIAKIEDEHRKRFEYYAGLMREGRLFRSEDPEEKWMCLNCGHIHTAGEAPLECPVCGAKLGYFIRFDEAAFTTGKLLT